MKDLIEALTILLKYGNPRNPTHCEHDVLTICGIEIEDVSTEDKVELKRLGFECDESEEAGGEIAFYSFRFGSA